VVLPRQPAVARLYEGTLQISADRVPVRRAAHVNARLGKEHAEYELVDTGIFDERAYFDIVVEYAKNGTEDV